MVAYAHMCTRAHAPPIPGAAEEKQWACEGEPLSLAGTLWASLSPLWASVYLFVKCSYC